MKRIASTLAVTLGLLLPSASLGTGKVLLLDDIGSEDAYFAWNRVLGGGVAFSATVDHEDCFDQYCYDYHSTGALDGFEREGRDVYYVGRGSRVLCGRTYGFLSRPNFDAACPISVEPELVCVERFSADDCVAAATRYRVYLTVGR